LLDSEQQQLDNTSLLLFVFANMLARPIALLSESGEHCELALPLCCKLDAFGQCAIVGCLSSGRYCALRRDTAVRHSVTLKAEVAALSAACMPVIESCQQACVGFSVTMPTQESLKYSAADATQRQLFEKLMRATDIEQTSLHNDSLDKACCVKLCDLRRLVTPGQWLNDEIINALLSLIVRSAPATQFDAFTSLIEGKLTQLVSSENGDEARKFAEKYNSLQGRTFTELCNTNVVSKRASVMLFIFIHIANFDSMAFQPNSLVVVVHRSNTARSVSC
jgi:hypothetical protein